MMKKKEEVKRPIWSDQIPKCQEHPCCGHCKYFFFARTIEQTLMQIPMCDRYAHLGVTCIILDEDLQKLVNCPFFKLAHFSCVR